ncbi:MAG: uroporphyrinogen-III C-methyltransferase [Planctomycetes bacterium]|nr:uroporphyrinogen-III C-methyltransferase [Planctomycetota bacterium]
MSSFSQPGIVYLVGAGPGDPGLITLRGAECLRRAEVVLFDSLANPQILEHAPPSAELLCVGKHGRTRIWSQDEINARMVEEARRGKTVVRLKGGDAAVFARIAEETGALLAAGVPFEIIPGITAALAAGAYAGIPITHRDFASAAALVTGQENPEKEGATLDWEALAQFPGTLVFYMGVTTARQWSEALIRHGKPPQTPAAIVRRCSLPDQFTIRCTLAEVAERMESHEGQRLRPPAIVIIGEVASLSPALAWFEQRPLFGKTILVTRPRGQAIDLQRRLGELGAEVLLQPAIEISDPPDWTPVDDAIERLSEFDWLTFSSANGVRFLLDRLVSVGRDTRALGSVRLAAIGPGTSQALAEYRLRVDLQPQRFDAEGLAEALCPDAAGKRFLLARASRGRDALPRLLSGAGGIVEQIVVYSSTDATQPDEEIAEKLADGRIDWITVTSSAIARSLAKLFGEQLHKARIASISPITTQTLRDLGYEPAAEASHYTMDGVVEAILAGNGVSGRGPGRIDRRR